MALGRATNVYLLLFLLSTSTLFRAQQSQLGKIVGQIRVERGDFPNHPVLVSLDMRGSPINSAYCDDQGRFGFYNLVGNQYRVWIDDEAYESVSETLEINPQTAPINFIQIILKPRSNAKKDSLPRRVGGSNPYLVDPEEYLRSFPKKTRKEYEKGLDAEHRGKIEEAMERYEAAIKLSPDFYPAHNNLGSLYQSQQDFERAQSEFEAVLKANQNDPQAYFNLANVLLMTQRYSNAERQIREGLQRQPDSAFGHFLEGSLFSHTGRAELAEKSLRDAIRLDPAMSHAYLQLINLYVQQKRNEDAINELETFLRLFPNTQFSPKARDLLARLQSEVAAAH
jgi:tetratricopeptide (TPR) repeat protein